MHVVGVGHIPNTVKAFAVTPSWNVRNIGH